MAGDRALRVSQSIKKEIAQMLQKDIRDERLTGLISITDVECTHDLRAAKVFVSVFQNTQDPLEQAVKAEKVVEALNEQSGYIRGEVCRRLGLRFAPEMFFRLDTSLERGSKVTDLLGKIARGEV
jgi:ribosome-binding factor A